MSVAFDRKMSTRTRHTGSEGWLVVTLLYEWVVMGRTVQHVDDT